MRVVVLFMMLVSSVATVLADLSTGYGIRARDVQQLAPNRPRSMDELPPKHLPIQRIQSRSVGDSWLQLFQVRLGAREHIARSTNSTRLTYLNTFQYVATLNIDGEDLQVVADTGSSDTWVIGKNFSCIDYDGTPLSKEYCSFGPAFKGDFKNKTLPRQKFSTRYGDGESVQGDFDFWDITIAGITVKNQQMGLVSKVYSGGDGVTSGLMGLAYPLLTDIFSAGVGDTTLGSNNQHKYDPIFTSMYKQKLISPLFSMSMDKNNSGWLTFGGLPPVDHAADFASTPIRMAEVYNVSSLKTEYSFYTIIADGYVYGNQNTTKLAVPASKWTNLFSIDAKVGQFPAIVDSGSTLMSLPTALADAYAAQFKPAAVTNVLTAEYWAPCTAKVPRFGVVIGGQTFFVAEADLLRQSSKLDWNGDGVMYCRLGVRDGYSGPFVLGDAFMNNVVSVFDVGASMMRFARRL